MARERVTGGRVSGISEKWQEAWNLRHRTKSPGPSSNPCLPCASHFAIRTQGGNRGAPLDRAKNENELVRHKRLFMPKAFAVLLGRAQKQTVRDVFVNGVSHSAQSAVHNVLDINHVFLTLFAFCSAFAMLMPNKCIAMLLSNVCI